MFGMNIFPEVLGVIWHININYELMLFVVYRGNVTNDNYTGATAFSII